MFTSTTPILKPRPTSYLAMNCMLNTLAWEVGLTLHKERCAEKVTILTGWHARAGENSELDVVHVSLLLCLFFQLLAHPSYCRSAGILNAEVPATFSVKMERVFGFPGDYCTWTTLPGPVVDRLPRLQLEKMLCRILFQTVLPAKYNHARDTYQPRDCLNVHAFFRTIYRLAELG